MSVEIDNCFNIAVQDLRKRDFQSASIILQEIIRAKPSFADAHEALGVAKENLEDLNGAIQEFKTALSLNSKSVPTLYDLADALIQQHQYDAAIFYLKQGLALAPSADQTFRLQLTLARAFDGTQQSTEAISLLRDLVAERPASPEAAFYLGNAYAHAKLYREASAAYAKCLSLDPENDVARLSGAKALILGGQFEAAVVPAQDYIRRHPDDYEGYLGEGRALKWLSRFVEAAAALQRAAQLEPDNYEIQYNLGLVLARLGKTDQALHELRVAERLDPENPEPRFELSRLLGSMGNDSDSQKELQTFRSLQLSREQKEQAQLLIAKGNELLQHGDPQGALAAYQSALAQTPSSAIIHYDVALAQGKLGDRPGEQRELEKALKLDPDFALAHNQLGLLYSAVGKDADAEGEFRDALRSNPAYAEAQNNLGALRGRQGDTAQAIELFRQAMANDPTYADPCINLALVLAGQGQFEQAEQELTKATELAANRADVFANLAIIQTRLGKLGEAVQASRKVVLLEPDSAPAHLQLAESLIRTFDLSAAVEQYSIALRIDPKSVPTYRLRGQALYDMGNYEEARNDLETSCSLLPDESASLYLLALVESLERHPSSAIHLLIRLVRRDPKNSNAQYLLGLCFMQVGKEDLAIESLKAAIQAHPENLRAASELAAMSSELGNSQGALFAKNFEALKLQQGLVDRTRLLDGLAEESMQARMWQEAAATLQQALEACGKCALKGDLVRKLGLVYLHQGNKEEGEQKLQAALRLNPNDSEAKELLRSLHSASLKF